MAMMLAIFYFLWRSIHGLTGLKLEEMLAPSGADDKWRKILIVCLVKVTLTINRYDSGQTLCRDQVSDVDAVFRLAELPVNDFRGEIDGGVVVVQMRFEILPDRFGINDSDMIRVLGNQQPG